MSIFLKCILSLQAGLGGHMLGIADEEGWVQILDSRRTSPKSLIKGMSIKLSIADSICSFISLEDPRLGIIFN